VFSLEEAKKFSRINHPVFAGYLLDGVVSELDLLATVFFLIRGSYLIPIFKDSNLSSSLIGIRKGLKKPPSMFDKIFIKELFNNSNEISSKQVGEKIKSDSLQFTMNYCFEVFTNIEAKNKKHFEKNLSNQLVEIEDKFEKSFDIKDKKISITITIVLAVLAIIRLFYERDLFPGILFFILVGILLYADVYSYFIAKKHVFYKLSSNVDIVKMRNDYESLYDFLSKYPLDNHYITNEFLPFSITFGIDQSWNRDFGLEKYIRIYPKI